MSFNLEDLKKKSKIQSPTTTELVKSGGITTQRLNSLRSDLGINNKGKSSLDSKVKSMAASVLKEASSILKESKTELIFIFDKSTSCEGTEKATMAGYNELIEKEKRSGYPTKVSTILFSDQDEIINFRTDIQSVKPLHYYAYGNTTLYDTLTYQLNKIKQEQDKDEIRPKTIVIIMTDGEDYGSVYNDENSVRKIVSICKSIGWQFIFLGANQDAKLVASTLGINPETAETFIADNQGYRLNFHAVSLALESYRNSGRIAPNWAEAIKQNNLALGSSNQNSGPRLTLGDGKN